MDKEERKAYNKVYHEANKEKAKAYCEANKEKISAAKKAYHKRTWQARREKRLPQLRAYYEANREKAKADSKAHYAANKEEGRSYAKTYGKAHRAERSASEAKREAVKRQAILPTTDNELIINLYKQRIDMTKERGEQYHVDHIIPLSIGGAHHQDNLRVIAATENMEKSNKYIPELGGVWADNDLAREYKKKHNIE